MSSEGHSEATLADYKHFSSSQPSGNLPAHNPSGLYLTAGAFLGLMQNPELASFSWEMRSAEARTLQQDSYPTRDFSRSRKHCGARELKGFNGAENTIQIISFLNGWKAPKRKKLAELEKDLSGWITKAKRLDVFTDITKAFGRPCCTGTAINHQGFSSTSEQVYTTVVERVKARKRCPI